MTTNEIFQLIRSEARHLGLDEDLGVAIALVESRGYPLACRFEPNWKLFLTPDLFAKKNGITLETEKIHQQCSWGVMQVMGCVARELGFEDPLPALCLPENGVRIGMRKLRQLSDKFESEASVIAAYNAGTPKRIAGVFTNQTYVDKVNDRLKNLRAIGT